MSSGPLYTTAMDTGEAVVEPLSASYPVDFIMNVELETKNGTDIPLYNKTLSMYDGSQPWVAHIMRGNGQPDDEFDIEKEDYWLFYCHLNYAELEIAIGGETPLYVNSRPNWKNITSLDSAKFRTTNGHGKHFNLSWDYGHDGFDRFVAVRTPKMDNPAITVRVQGHYGAIHWVGLFAKSATNNTNHFIAVRTSNRLLPKYAARTKKYAGYEKWYSEDGPANILDAHLTLYPKQLFGTQSNSGALYDQFVTSDPMNPIGPKHFEHVFRKFRGRYQWPWKYVWSAADTTYILLELEGYWQRRDSPNPHTGDTHNWIEHKEWFDYISGVTLKQESANGWTVLLSLFGSVSQILTGVLSTSVAGVIQGLFSLGDVFDEKKMRQEADVKGFITSVAQGVDAYNGRRGGKKKQDTPNVTNILVLTKNVQNNTFVARDFGAASPPAAIRPSMLAAMQPVDDAGNELGPDAQLQDDDERRASL